MCFVVPFGSHFIEEKTRRSGAPSQRSFERMTITPGLKPAICQTIAEPMRNGSLRGLRAGRIISSQSHLFSLSISSEKAPLKIQPFPHSLPGHAQTDRFSQSDWRDYDPIANQGPFGPHGPFQWDHEAREIEEKKSRNFQERCHVTYRYRSRESPAFSQHLYKKF
jgi:hypothetical protein